jgi:hypothetical protein
MNNFRKYFAAILAFGLMGCSGNGILGGNSATTDSTGISSVGLELSEDEAALKLPEELGSDSSLPPPASFSARIARSSTTVGVQLTWTTVESALVYVIERAESFALSGEQTNEVVKDPKVEHDFKEEASSDSEKELLDSDESQRITFRFRRIGAVLGSASEFFDASPTRGQVFIYRICASDGLNCSEYAYSDRVYYSQPAAPANFLAVATSPDTVTLTWVDRSLSEDRYEVYQDHSLVDTIVRNSTSHVVRRLSANTRYEFFVRAANELGSSDSSVQAAVTMLNTAPRIPSNLSVNVLASPHVRLTWTQEEGPVPIAAFDILKTVNGVATTTNVAATVREFIFDAPANADISLSVRAINGSGTSAYSSPAITRTSPPIAPTLSWAPNGSSSVRLQWIDNSVNESRFSIQQLSGTDFQEIQSLAPNSVTYTVQDLTPSSYYVFRVVAVNGLGAGESTPVTVRTVQGAPRAPSLNPVSCVFGRVIMNWTNIANNGAQSMDMEFSRNDGYTFNPIASLNPNLVGEQRYEHQLPNANGDYRFRLRLTNASGNAYSNDVIVIKTNNGWNCLL